MKLTPELKEIAQRVINSMYHDGKTVGNAFDFLEWVLAALPKSEPIAYHENGRWSFNSDGGPDKWRERKKYNGPLYAAPSIPQDYKDQLDEANNERKWVRRKLKLPEDTGFLTGEVTLAGTMHNVCSGNHGYRTYIEAEKCDDKAGRIARLTVQLDESQAREKKLREAFCDCLSDLKGGFVRCENCGDQEDTSTLDVVPIMEAALAVPSDATALNELIAKAVEVMRERCTSDLRRFHDVTPGLISHSELRTEVYAICALPGVTLEGKPLYTADAILSAVKPLRDRIAELEANASTMKAYYEQVFEDGVKRIAELEAYVANNKMLWDAAETEHEEARTELDDLREQNAELTKQRDWFLSALESIKNASQSSCSFHDIRVFASEAIAKYK